MILIFYIGDFKISLKPFHIEINAWYNLIGYIFAIFAFAFLSFNSYNNGYKQGVNDTVNLVQKTLDKKVVELHKETKDTVTVNENHSEIPKTE
jgi:hypothetical protein